VKLAIAEHRHRGVQQLVTPLFAGESRGVLAPRPGSGHEGNITSPLYSLAVIATVALY
jgi:hypothetical protein